MSVPVGDPNPWMLLSQLGVLLLIVFVADATATAWRRGEREMTARRGCLHRFFSGSRAWSSTSSLFVGRRRIPR